MSAPVDYLSDAPGFAAWAGTGPRAERVYDQGKVTELRAAVNVEVSRLVEAGMPVDEALTAYDPEAIAADVLDE